MADCNHQEPQRAVEARLNVEKRNLKKLEAAIKLRQHELAKLTSLLSAKKKDVKYWTLAAPLPSKDKAQWIADYDEEHPDAFKRDTKLYPTEETLLTHPDAKPMEPHQLNPQQCIPTRHRNTPCLEPAFNWKLDLVSTDWQIPCMKDMKNLLITKSVVNKEDDDDNASTAADHGSELGSNYRYQRMCQYEEDPEEDPCQWPAEYGDYCTLHKWCEVQENGE